MQQLKIIQKLLETYPDSHVGGSIGLFLLGVDLQRSLEDSDVDFSFKSVPEFVKIADLYVRAGSSPDDFKYPFTYYGDKKKAFKVDGAVRPESVYQNVVHEGFHYRVTPLADITAFKVKYAFRGVKKHAVDLIVMSGATDRQTAQKMLEEKIAAGEKDSFDDIPF